MRWVCIGVVVLSLAGASGAVASKRETPGSPHVESALTGVLEAARMEFFGRDAKTAAEAKSYGRASIDVIRQVRHSLTAAAAAGEITKQQLAKDNVDLDDIREADFRAFSDSFKEGLRIKEHLAYVLERALRCGGGRVQCGTAGKDVCTGGPGNDVCVLGGGTNVCNLGAGNDVCIGGSGNDTCIGGPGNDACLLGAGANTCDGGPGDDVCNGVASCTGARAGHDICTKQPLFPTPPPPAASASYSCDPNALSEVIFRSAPESFDPRNGYANSGSAPSFSTNGKAYCLDSLSTTHYNDGNGKAPGSIGLVSSDGTKLGPWPAHVLKDGFTWRASPPAGSSVILNGTYTVVDSDPSTWTSSAASGGRSFAVVSASAAKR